MSTTDAAGRRYRIAEVARLTGFTPSTLRYYEDAGVLAPPPRTAAGYRVYDDRAVERLRLVARAKELGCTLEEIAGLVEAWDSDECEPVQHRLRSLVSAKIGEVERHIAEQVALAAELRATAATLAARPADGPCDDGCGCMTAADAGSAEVPIACSLSGGDMQDRVAEWQSLLGGVERREEISSGLRLVFRHPAPLADISRLAAAEYECCPFFSFAITVDGRGVGLEVTAPAHGQELLEAVFGPRS